MINDTWTSESKGALSEQQGNGSMAPRPLKRTYALYFESDEDTNDEEQLQGIDDVLANIHSCYPAMNFLQYVKMLKEHGIFYLPTTMHFNSRFYVEKVGTTTRISALSQTQNIDDGLAGPFGPRCDSLLLMAVSRGLNIVSRTIIQFTFICIGPIDHVF
ncbi:hypothetical protein BD769DRAFT_1669222 [Suillus cothurnatus]|nr:hypothetical protein BD769DRAFT_1669222 [Suillus cothurnatus]